MGAAFKPRMKMINTTKYKSSAHPHYTAHNKPFRGLCAVCGRAEL